jgi:Putative DNA-binding domain
VGSEHGLESPLVRVQRFVTDAIRLASPIADHPEVAARAESLVASSARGMQGQERLEVYREQFWLRHLSNLEDDYPTLVWATGGREAFQELAGEYLGACPPQTWNLQELGARLPAFLGGHARWCGDAIARDAARLDRAFVEVFDAPDAPPLDPRVFGSAPEEAWPQARVEFHPALRPLSLAHPLHELRDAVKRGELRDRPFAQPTDVIVWRDAECFLRAIAVEPLPFELLGALRNGVALGEACEALARSSQAVDPSTLGPRVGEWFQEWTTRGWVVAAHFD